MDPLISIVIPVYNAASHIERCIKSVTSQTYSNLEIILVNDGSTDNSEVICEKLASNDSRIKIFKKNNGGAADARNFGVEKATGDYLAFVDSDDIIATFYIEYLLNNLIKYNADISCCNYLSSPDLSVVPTFYITDDKVRISSGKDTCIEMINEITNFSLTVPWCKLCKTSIIKNNPFPIGHTREDEATSCKYYHNSKTVVISTAQLYLYYDNPTSVMHGDKSKLKRDMVWALEYRCKYFESQNEPEIEKAAITSFLNFLIYSENPKRFDKDFLAFLKKYWFSTKINIRARIKIVMFLLSPKLFRKFLNSL